MNEGQLLITPILSHSFLSQVYQTDPSGNYGGWRATCIGANNTAGKSVLKSEYTDDMDVQACLQLAAKVCYTTYNTNVEYANR